MLIALVRSIVILVPFDISSNFGGGNPTSVNALHIFFMPRPQDSMNPNLLASLLDSIGNGKGVAAGKG